MNNKKVIYKSRVETYLNNERIDIGTCSYWNYGELPEDKIYKEFLTFEDFYANYGFDHKTLFKHEPFVRLGALTHEAVFGKIRKSDFESYRVITKYAEVQYDVTMNRLMQMLTAEDFIAYCKDHGLSVCPIK